MICISISVFQEYSFVCLEFLMVGLETSIADTVERPTRVRMVKICGKETLSQVAELKLISCNTSE